MAKPELQDNRKFTRFIRGMRLPRYACYGLIATLWDFAYEQGDPYIGDKEDVEEICGWDGKPGVLFEALLDPTASKTDGAGFIEPVPGKEGKYRVHALYEHAPDYVKAKMERKGTAPPSAMAVKAKRKELRQKPRFTEPHATVNEPRVTAAEPQPRLNGRSLPTQPNPTQPNPTAAAEATTATAPVPPPAAELLLPLKSDEGQSPELLLRQEGVGEDAIVELRGMPTFSLRRVVEMVNNARYLQKTRRLTGSRGGYIRAALTNAYDTIPEAQPKGEHPEKIAAAQATERRRREAEDERAAVERERQEQADLIEAASAQEIEQIVTELKKGLPDHAVRAYHGKTVHDCPGLARLVAGKLKESRAKNGERHEARPRSKPTGAPSAEGGGAHAPADSPGSGGGASHPVPRESNAGAGGSAVPPGRHAGPPAAGKG